MHMNDLRLRRGLGLLALPLSVALGAVVALAPDDAYA